MTTKRSQLIDLAIVPGVMSRADMTQAATKHWTFADKMRFVDGYPQKIGGWEKSEFAGNDTLDGTARSIFSAALNGSIQTVIGTNTKLYGQVLSNLTNITPLETDTTAIADSLNTDYGTLGNDPIATVSGSNTLTITDSNAQYYEAGDIITLSGATTTGGITDTILNDDHMIRTASAGSYTIIVSANASSTTSGGGASVVRATGRITVDATAHGMANGDRVKIADAATTGGIADTAINAEFLIRNVTTDAFDIFTAGTATSAVTGGGGADTTYQKEIPVGLVDERAGQGYGMGLYGDGLYGISKQSSSLRGYPRIWFFDRYGDTIIATPGNQTGIYQWDGGVTVAPALVANAPTTVNYAFISDNILVTFGAGGIENKIFSSDQNAITQWTASSTNQVFEDNIEGAGRLKSHVPVTGMNLIFTENRTYSFRYIGLPLVWDIELVEPTIGVIAPMARVSVGGAAYWMGRDNFYMWRGSQVEIIPANTQEQSTILEYVFGDLNTGQKSKCFAWYNRQFNEVWFHYPSAASDEPDRIARVNLKTFVWVMDTIDRTAAEYPDNLLGNPRMVGGEYLYKHEIGTDADGSPLGWELQSHLRTGPKDNSTVTGFIPDSIQTGDITVTIEAQRYPQSAQAMQTKEYTVTPTTEYVPTMVSGRYWKYTLSGSALGQQFALGAWREYVQTGAGF